MQMQALQMQTSGQRFSGCTILISNTSVVTISFQMKTQNSCTKSKILQIPEFSYSLLLKVSKVIRFVTFLRLPVIFRSK